MGSSQLTHVSVAGTNVIVVLSWKDKAAALVGDQVVPLAAISSVSVVPDPLQGISGIRSPGLTIPRGAKVGVWRQRGHRTLVVVRRHQHAVRIEAVGQRFDSYLIGADDALAVEATIRTARERR
jgi:hypothetical protein